MRNVPSRIVLSHFSQVAIVADMVADSILIDIREFLGLARERLRNLKGFQNGAAIRLPAAEIIDFGATRCFDKRGHELGYVLRMDIVPYLLSLVAKNTILAFFEIALHKVTQEAMELYAGMVGACQATATKAAGGHVEIATVLLNYDIGCNLGCSKKGVFGLIDGKALCDSVLINGVCIVPTSFEFL